jgi:hypothetical protein
MRAPILGVAVLFAGVGIVLADEFRIVIKEVKRTDKAITSLVVTKDPRTSKRDGNVTLELAKDVVVTEGKYVAKSLRIQKEGKLEGGLSSPLFDKFGVNGLPGSVVTNADGKVTELVIVTGSTTNKKPKLPKKSNPTNPFLNDATAAADKPKSETIKLFNGKNLDGWEGYEDLWSVKEGVIVAKNTKPLKFSTYLVTKRHFTDFRLLFSAKLVTSEMHSGVALWGKLFVPKEAKDVVAEKAQYTYQGHLVMFPSGWGLYDLYRRAGAINPGKEIREVAMKAGKQHEWNDMEILAVGARIRLAVNGKAVLDWTDKEPKLVGEGPIGLQLHSNNVPQEVHFKGLELTTFPKDDKLLTVK